MRRPTHPRLVNTLLDSCAFDPKLTEQEAAARQIRQLQRDGVVSVVIAHSTAKEVDHPNTPADVKQEARQLVQTFPTNLTPREAQQLANIETTLAGNGDPAKYRADARHVFEAGKYGGYFVTTDQRVLSRRDLLTGAFGAMILTPVEWLERFRDGA